MRKIIAFLLEGGKIMHAPPKKLLDQACPDWRSCVERVRDAIRLKHHSLSPNKLEQKGLIQFARGLLTHFGRDACVVSDTKFAS